MLVVDAIAQALENRGVRYVFGMPGGATVPLMAALDRVGIEFVLVRHEGSAGFMADAIFQRTGHLGVCVSTLGPGATNLISGVAQAFTERSKVLAIVGQCEDDLRPTYTHQIIDQAAMFSPICHGYHRLRSYQPSRHLYTVFQSVDSIDGPVVIELSTSVSNAASEPVPVITTPSYGVPSVEQICQRLERSTHPIIVVGAECLSLETSQAINTLARQCHIPVFTTYRGKGVIDERSDWSLGAIGLSPVVDDLQQAWINQGDVIVLIGFDMVEMRPNWLDGWGTDADVISISQKGQPDIPHSLCIDWRGSIQKGVETLVGNLATEWTAKWRVEEVDAQKKKVQQIFIDTSLEGLNPAGVIKQIQQSLPEDIVLCLDVGAHRITASHVWKARIPRMILQSNGFSSMGVGLPMAIAVALQEPKTPVLALTGDMGLWMSLGELGIIQERGLHVIVVYLSDSALSLIELKQERSATPKQTGVRFRNPETVSLAKAFGGRGVVCETLQSVDRALEYAKQHPGLHLIEIQINPRYYRAQM